MDARSTQKQIITAAFVLCALILIVRLFVLQVVNKEYKVTAFNNVLKYEVIYPARGLIYDRNGAIIVDNQTTYDITVTPREMKDFDTLAFQEVFSLTREGMTQLMDNINSQRRKIGYQSMVLLKQITPEEHARFLEIAYKFPGFAVQSRSIRGYETPLCGNLLGYIIEADPKFLEKHPEYKAGDYVGKTGLEETYEPYLKGEKGNTIYLRDVHNRIKASYENGAHDKAAVPGKDVISTIDAPLQAFGEQLMKNKVGAIVALDPSNGEVLTLITSTGLPAKYLSNFSRHYADVIVDPLKPMFNRAIMSAYPPGSVFKLINGLIGLQEGVLTPETKYGCSKGYHVGRGVACHAHPSPINLQQSVMMSCNAYYCYVLRNILDNPAYDNISASLTKWRSYVESFGFGHKLGIDIPGELSGTLPSAALYDRYHGKNRWKSLTIISLAIGQGEIGATPLQLANMAAIMANRGHYFTPHIIREVVGDTLFRPSMERHDVLVDSSHFPVIVEGMYQAVNSAPGSGATARIACVPGLDICGKTGTAQNPHGEDNSVFICFAPRENPKIAVAVYVEQGGFGATWAAPIASLMVEKYLNDSISDTPARQDILNRVLQGDLLYRVLK